MQTRHFDRWLSIGWFLYALVVLAPLLGTESAPGEDDAIAARLGDTFQAQLARNVASLYYDDSFYYLEIARRVAGGEGPTFDGRNPTNGYHPLWLLCLIPLACWLPSAEDLLLASFALQALAAALTTVLVFRIARRVFAVPAAAVAAAWWIRIQSTYWMSWAGMEYGLQALAVAGSIYAYLRLTEAGHDPRRCLALGVLASAAFLARLDNLLLAALIGLALALRAPASTRWRAGVLFAAPVAVTAAAYFGFNLWFFDSPWPVSGELKRAWSIELLASDPIYLRHGWLAAKASYLLSPLWHLSRSFAASLLLGALGGGVLAVLAVRRRVAWPFELWPLGAFAALQVLAYTAFYHGGFSFHPWYYVTQHLVAALLAATLVEAAWNRAVGVGAGRVRRWGAALLLAVIFLSTALIAERRRERQRRFAAEPLYAAAGWMRANLHPGATVGAWNAGILAFFSDRRVVDLDGLVNSRSFARSHRHDLCAYFDREGVGYVVDVFDAERPFAQYEAQIGPCVSRLETIWTGPSYPGSSPPRRALAYRWAPGHLR